VGTKLDQGVLRPPELRLGSDQPLRQGQAGQLLVRVRRRFPFDDAEEFEPCQGLLAEALDISLLIHTRVEVAILTFLAADQRG
jgi:hypothetical protein